MFGIKKKKRKQISKKAITTLQKMTFSKIWISRILACSIIWITLSYILAFLGRTEIAQDLSQQIVIVIIASLLSYFLKSFFETKEEETIKLQRDMLNIDSSDTPEDIEEMDNDNNGENEDLP